jgi:small membrane protein
MRPIQPILLVGALIALGVYLRYLRSSLRDRVVVAGLLLAFMTAVAVPDLTQRAANLLGVGRGTDLTLYCFILVATFVGIMLYAKVVRLHRALTVVVRELALLHAREGTTRAPGPDARRDA